MRRQATTTASDNKFRRRIDKAIRRVSVYDVLDTMELKYKQQGSGDLWLRCFLPAHKGGKRPSLHIYASPGHERFALWKCFGCGAAGNIITLVQYVRDIKFTQALFIVENHQRSDIDDSVNPVYNKPIPQLPKFFVSPSKKEDWEKSYYDYLIGRGIEWWQIKKHRIGYTDAGKYINRVIIPVTLGNEFTTFIARSIDSEVEKRVTGARGGKPGLFGSNFIDSKEPAIVCEGWADKLAIERVGYSNVFSLQRNEVHKSQYEFLKTFKYTIFIPDGDDGGDHLVDSLGQYIDDMKILVADIPRDKDPAECTKDEIESAISNAGEWRPRKVEVTVEVDY